MTHLLLWGNAHAQVIRNGRAEAAALYPLMPDRMTVDRDSAGRIFYEYLRVDSDARTLGRKSIVQFAPEDSFSFPAAQSRIVCGTNVNSPLPPGWPICRWSFRR